MSADDEVVRRLLPAIPADVLTGPAGRPLTEEEIEAVRLSRAQRWAHVGFSDPDVVRAWISAGVVDHEVAEVARRRGFRPGDPWVPTGFCTDFEWSIHRDQPSLGRFAGWVNRRRARRAWVRQESVTAAAKARTLAEIADVADAFRERVTAGSGSPDLLAAFDVAAVTAAGPDPELVAGAVDAAAALAGTLCGMAIEATSRMAAEPAVAVAFWLQERLVGSDVPSGDSIPLEVYGGALEQWIEREAGQLADYARYVRDFVEPLRRRLDRLSPDEAATATATLDAAAGDLDTARRLWGAIARQ